MPEKIPIHDEKDKSLHEIDFLQGRIKNLTVFKKMFFTLQEDLVEERKKTADLEARLKDDSQVNQTHIECQEASGLKNEHSESPAITSNSQTDLSEIKKLKEDFANLEQLNQMLISVADEYLSVIDFYSKGSEQSNYKDLILLLFDSMVSFNCEMSAEVRCYDGELNFFFNDKLQDEHVSLLRRLKIRGRLVEDNNVICVNLPYISFLIDGLPKNDERVYLRVKEILLLLVSGTNNIIKSLDIDKKLQAERKNLYKIVRGTQKNIEKIEQDIGRRIQETGRVQVDFIVKISEVLGSMGLSIDDKKKLNTLLNAGKNSLSHNLKKAYVLDTNFLDVISKLEKAYSFIDEVGKQVSDDK